MSTTIFQPIAKKTFESLVKTHGLYCISIYIPLYKSGKEQNEHLAQANLKRCLKKINEQLTEHQLSNSDISKYLAPIEELLKNSEFWRNPSEGLAIFLDKQGLKYYNLPIHFNTYFYVADHFYLLPLLPLFHENEKFYILELSQDYVQLYEANKFGYKKLSIEGFIPKKLEETVGFDYKQKNLQYRSNQNGFGSSNLHGKGEGKDDAKKELQTFTKAIDKGLNKFIKTKKATLIIASISQLFDIYSQESTYPNLFKQNIAGDPEFKNKNMLHQEACVLLKDVFETRRNEKIKMLSELYNSQKTAYEVSDIIRASFNGKVNTLFVKQNEDLFGVFNNENQQIKIDSKKKLQNASLINFCAINTFLKGGEVYFLPANKMPIEGQPLNALYHY